MAEDMLKHLLEVQGRHRLGIRARGPQEHDWLCSCGFSCEWYADYLKHLPDPEDFEWERMDLPPDDERRT